MRQKEVVDEMDNEKQSWEVLNQLLRYLARGLRPQIPVYAGNLLKIIYYGICLWQSRRYFRFRPGEIPKFIFEMLQEMALAVFRDPI